MATGTILSTDTNPRTQLDGGDIDDVAIPEIASGHPDLAKWAPPGSGTRGIADTELDTCHIEPEVVDLNLPAMNGGQHGEPR